MADAEADQAPQDLLAVFDDGADDVFRWCCHLLAGDGVRAGALFVNACRQADLDGVVDGADMRARIERAALRQARLTNAHDGALMHRAVLSQGLDGRWGDDVVAAVLDVPIAKLDGMRVDAQQWLAHEHWGAAPAEVLRHVERWLDDETRARGRDGVDAALRARRAAGVSRPAAGWGPPAVDGRGAADETRSADAERVRRRGAWVAAAVVVAAVGGFAIGSWSAGDDESASPDTTAPDDSTPRSTTTTDRPTTTTDTPPPEQTFEQPPGVVLDEPPAGWYASPASEFDGSRGEFSQGWYQLWAEPDASRTSGRWFLINANPWSRGHAYELSAQRFVVGDRRGLMIQRGDGLIEAFTDVNRADGDGFEPGRRELSITAHGFSAEELQAIIGSVSPDSLRANSAVADLRYDTATFDPLTTGLNLLISASTTCCDPGLLGSEIGGYRQIAYFSATEDIALLTTSAWSELLTVTMPFVLESVRTAEVVRQVGGNTTPIEVTAGVFYWDNLGTPTPVTFVRWPSAEEQVTMVTTLSVDDALSLVAQTRRSTIGEWARLGVDPPDIEPPAIEPEPEPDVRAVGKVVIDRATLEVGVSVEPFVIRLGVPLDYGIVAEVRPQRNAEVYPLATFTSTVVVVVIEDPGAGATVRVTVEGQEPSTVELVQVAETTTFAAVTTLEPIGPYQVELVDGAGQVVRPLVTAARAE